MDITTPMHSNRIDCYLARDEPGLLDELGLCVLIEARHRGTIVETTFHRFELNGAQVVNFSIQFKDFTKQGDARVDFKRNLLPDGQVDPAILGAFRHADPGQVRAVKIRDQLMAL